MTSFEGKVTPTGKFTAHVVEGVANCLNQNSLQCTCCKPDSYMDFELLKASSCQIRFR
jgi:hypothetical protein